MGALSRRWASLVLLVALTSTTLVIPSLPLYVHAGDVLVPAQWRQAHPGPYTVTVAVFMDEEWRARFGPEAEREARAILQRVDHHFRDAGISIQPVLYGRWTSDEDATIQVLLARFRELSQTAPADLAVALSAGFRGAEGGIAGADRRHILVKHHPYRPDRDAFVLAHEIGHALGLDHHGCPHRYCIMSDHAYDPKEHWCPDHLRLLKANGGYFQFLQSPGEGA